jgi:hypothetical protein
MQMAHLLLVLLRLEVVMFDFLEMVALLLP